MGSAAASRFGCVGCATAVVAGDAVADGAALGNGHHRVADAVRAELGDGLGAAFTAAQLSACIEGNAAEYICASTGQGVGHTGTVAETGGKNARLIDTEAGLNLVQNGVGHLDISTARVGPAGVYTFRCNKDGGVIGQWPQAVEWLVGGAAVTAFGDLGGVAAQPVIRHNQAVGGAVVVIIWHTENKGAVGAAHINTVTAILQCA